MTLAQATKKILITDPFYGFVLMSLNKRFDNKVVDTACVTVSGINYELVVNEDYWNASSEEQQLATLKHELLHVCLFHLEMFGDFPNRELFNIAADMEVNSYIDKVQDDDFVRAENWGFPVRQGVKWYYEHIQQNLSENKNKGNSTQEGSLPDVKNHKSWKTMENMSDSEKQLLHNQMDYILKNATESAVKNHGSIPGEMAEYIKNLLKPKPPVFNWKSYLRRLVGMAEKYYLKITRKKPSKRFESASGVRHKHFQNVLVAVDTSGSVSTKELADFYAEMKNISRSGAEIDVVECDAGITKMYPLSKWDGSVHGRGGTSFMPVFDFFNKRGKKEYSALIYFTDGYCSVEGLKSSKPVIWVITSNGERKDYPGKVCYIQEENNE